MAESAQSEIFCSQNKRRHLGIPGSARNLMNLLRGLDSTREGTNKCLASSNIFGLRSPLGQAFKQFDQSATDVEALCIFLRLSLGLEPRTKRQNQREGCIMVDGFVTLKRKIYSKWLIVLFQAWCGIWLIRGCSLCNSTKRKHETNQKLQLDKT